MSEDERSAVAGRPEPAEPESITAECRQQAARIQLDEPRHAQIEWPSGKRRKALPADKRSAPAELDPARNQPLHRIERLELADRELLDAGALAPSLQHVPLVRLRRAEGKVHQPFGRIAAHVRLVVFPDPERA